MNVYYTVVGYREGCDPCKEAVALLTSRGALFRFYAVEDHPDLKEMVVGMGAKTLPQIWYGFDHIGGRDDLKNFLGVS